MSIKKQRIYSANVAIDMFYNKETEISNCSKAVIIINGFPDFAGPSTYSTFFASNNMIVFQPHIEGTYDSSGFFSPAGVKNTFSLINSMIATSSFSFFPNEEPIKQPWNISKVYIVGHSFGGILVLRYSNFILSSFDGILLSSPALHYAPKYGCKEDGPEHYKNVQKKYPYTYRLAPIEAWDSILLGKDPLPDNYIFSADKIQIIYGKKDSYFNLDMVNHEAVNLVKKYIKTNDCSLEIIDGAGHSSAELLKQKTTLEILKDMFGIG